jgi:hypothetical protein
LPGKLRRRGQGGSEHGSAARCGALRCARGCAERMRGCSMSQRVLHRHARPSARPASGCAVGVRDATGHTPAAQESRDVRVPARRVRGGRSRRRRAEGHVDRQVVAAGLVAAGQQAARGGVSKPAATTEGFGACRRAPRRAAWQPQHVANAPARQAAASATRREEQRRAGAARRSATAAQRAVRVRRQPVRTR